MSSPAQILANQTNSLASTGPRTSGGKAAVSQNALKFGLTSQQVVLPHEDPAAFEALHAGLLNQLKPANDAEHLWVDNGAVAEWRVRRAERTQHAWIMSEMKKNPGADADVAYSALMLSNEVRKFQKYAAAYRRERESAWKKLKEMQKERRAEEAKQAEAARQAELVQRNQERRLQIKAKWEAQNPGKTYPESQAVDLDTRRICA